MPALQDIAPPSTRPNPATDSLLFHSSALAGGGGGNQFDNLQVDVPALYARHPIDRKKDAFPLAAPFARSPWHHLCRSRLIPLATRARLRALLRRTNVDESWFREFREYWTGVLGGRPLIGVQDFYFLKNLYRVRFQRNQVPDTADPHTHLAAWQRPELLYQLLHLVYKETVADETAVLRVIDEHHRGPRSRMLEFGCGTAPIAASLFEFRRPPRDLRLYIADLQSLAFHYAAHRFRRCSNVVPVLLRPEDDFDLTIEGPLDVIACIQAAEHLNAPLRTFRRFHELLRPGGTLVFDYINTDGGAMDTLHGARERDAVLDFIGRHFDIVLGSLTKDRSMSTTVARRR